MLTATTVSFVCHGHFENVVVAMHPYPRAVRLSVCLSLLGL